MEHEQILQCDECFRRVGLWQPAMDLIEEHRPFCPYRESTILSRNTPITYLLTKDLQDISSFESK
jgi:uncharacterized protein (DUF2461 family)